MKRFQRVSTGGVSHVNKVCMYARQNYSKKYVETNPAIINEIPDHNLLRYNEYFVLSLAVRKNGMTIQMVDKPNTTPVGEDRETLTFK